MGILTEQVTTEDISILLVLRLSQGAVQSQG
jgi:hypothetical protein